MIPEEPFVSKLNTTPPPQQPFHETLGERRTFMARHATFGETPTLKELEKHAERFGTELVVQTAAELSYGFDSLVRLQDACDRFDAAAERARRSYRPAKKLTSSEDRVKELLGIQDEELIESC